MKDNVIEQAADELARVTTSPRSYCVLLAESLAQAGLLRPKIDEAMIERAARVLFEESQELDQDNAWGDGLPDDWRNEWRYVAREALEAALGGEQND